MGLDTFKAQRKAVLASLPGANLSSAEREFIKRWLFTRPSYSLETRLGRLAKGIGVLSNWNIDAARMAELRNDVAHGNVGVDPHELRAAYDQALDLARCLVLHELGI